MPQGYIGDQNFVAEKLSPYLTIRQSATVKLRRDAPVATGRMGKNGSEGRWIFSVPDDFAVVLGIGGTFGVEEEQG